MSTTPTEFVALALAESMGSSDFANSVRVDILSFAQLVVEVVQLRAKVTELQEGQTQLVLENRSLRSELLAAIWCL